MLVIYGYIGYYCQNIDEFTKTYDCYLTTF